MGNALWALLKTISISYVSLHSIYYFTLFSQCVMSSLLHPTKEKGGNQTIWRVKNVIFDQICTSRTLCQDKKETMHLIELQVFQHGTVQTWALQKAAGW